MGQQEMKDLAHIKTDKEIAKIEKELQAFYKSTQGDNMKAWGEYMESIEPRVKQAYKTLEEARKTGNTQEISVAKQEYERLVRNMTFKQKRYKEVVRDTAKRMTLTNEQATAIVNERMYSIYAMNYNYNMEKMVQFDKDMSFKAIDENMIRNMIADGNHLALPQRKLSIPDDTAWNVKQINNQMAKGLYLGEDIYKIADRLQNVSDMGLKQSIRNARTLATANENKARQQTAEDCESAGVIVGKYWLHTHDDRTRPEHVEAGEEYSKDNAIPIDEPFIVGGEELMYPADETGSGWNVYNCRCSYGTTVIGFKDKKHGKVQMKWGE